jgi:hypothetical protein
MDPILSNNVRAETKDKFGACGADVAAKELRKGIYKQFVQGLYATRFGNKVLRTIVGTNLL